MEKPISQAHLENGIYGQIVTKLKRELELVESESLDELKANRVSQYATKNSDKPRLTCYHCNKPRLYKNQCLQLKKQKEQAADTKTSSENNNGAPLTLIPPPSITTAITTVKRTENLELPTLCDQHFTA